MTAHDLIECESDLGDIPFGWRLIVETACSTITGWGLRPKETPLPLITSVGVGDGMLDVQLAGGHAGDRGSTAAARALSGEFCEKCEGKGDPVEDGTTGKRGTRCRVCRSTGHTALEREWSVEAQPDHPHIISPGQYTADIRGRGTGADWDETDWRNYGRLETLYAVPIAHLMRADNDAEAMALWPGGAGWAGLLRALFITLRPEQYERPEDPEHIPWRLRYMKEKWGGLRVRSTATTAYQNQVMFTVESMSTRTCERCGAPGATRGRYLIRAMCERCFEEDPEPKPFCREAPK